MPKPISVRSEISCHFKNLFQYLYLLYFLNVWSFTPSYCPSLYNCTWALASWVFIVYLYMCVGPIIHVPVPGISLIGLMLPCWFMAFDVLIARIQWMSFWWAINSLLAYQIVKYLNYWYRYSVYAAMFITLFEIFHIIFIAFAHLWLNT